MGLGDRFKRIFGQGRKDDEEIVNENGIVEFESSSNESFEVVEENNSDKIELPPNANVLFVCSGNADRSPIAEAIFNQKANGQRAFSAGLNAKTGNGASENAIIVCADHGIDLSGHRTHNIRDISINEIDLVLAATANIRDALKVIYPNSDVFTVKEYAGDYSDPDIADPFGGDLSVYEECFKEIDGAISKILNVNVKITDKPTPASEIIDNPSKTRNFKYFEDLILRSDEEIFLDSDIVLDDGEEFEYSDGIQLDMGGIVIDGNGHSVDAKHMARIFSCSGWNITIKNITLKNGYSKEYGGAIYVNGSLKVIGSAIRNSMSERGGGAIYNDGTLTVKKSTLIKNSASCGGAIYGNYSNTNIIESVFINNTSKSSGGAIASQHGEMVITKSTFSKNTTNGRGGAINNYFGEVTITESTLNENVSRESGGAVWSNGGLTIDESIFSECKANENGGAIRARKMTISKSTLNGNEASGSGGAICNAGELTVKESSFNKNAGKDGGAICSADELNIECSTFSENASIKSGGAICSSGQSIITNSTLSQNTSRDFAGAINNHGGNMTVEESSFNANASNGGGNDICNSGTLYTEENNLKTLDINSDVGKIYGLKSSKQNQRDFTYLNELISSQTNEIKLETDILLNKSNWEDELFRKGIIIEEDIVIDGDNHMIDAQGLARIFFITSGKVSLKNIIFKNGATDESGGAIYNGNGANLELNNCSFSENTAGYRGGAIDNEGELAIDGSSFTKNRSKSWGGAIYDTGDLSIISSNFDENVSEDGKGGAIFKFGNELSIVDSTFTKNISQDDGGAICNSGRYLNISESTFAENMATGTGGAIYNKNGNVNIRDSTIRQNISERGAGAISSARQNGLPILKIFQTTISSNRSPDNIVFNNGYLELYNTKFEDNQCGHVLINRYEDFNVSIIGGEFTGNAIKKAAVLNEGKSLSIQKTIFDNTLVENSDNIINMNDLTLIEPRIKNDGKTILNEGHILLQKSLDCEGKIYGDGEVENDLIPQEEKFDFGYLDRIVHKSYSNEIVLEEDVHFENYEKDFYEGGIELDIDGMVIDGNGHTIDAAGKSRIFVVTANNVTLKNIIFKNGHSHINYYNKYNASGGAIRINCDNELTIENCRFINNCSEASGGAIINRNSNLIMADSILRKNMAQEGGSIFNEGNLDVCQTRFYENESKYSGGAIHSKGGDVNISDSMLAKNRGSHGGAVYNTGRLTISDARFAKNASKNGGGAVFTGGDGEAVISKSKFYFNSSNMEGGAILNGGVLKVLKSQINNNAADNRGGGIHNGGILAIEDCELTDNDSRYEGGAIGNEYEVSISKSILENNTAKDTGGAIFNKGIAKIAETSLASDSTDFEEIYNEAYLIIKRKFSTNQSKPIVNHGRATACHDVIGLIDNSGKLMELKRLENGKRDFTYLNDLIQSGGEITLESDILLDVEGDEDEMFSQGIEINGDGMTIDGAGHTIDAQGMARLFKCCGKNVTFKNVILKSGFARTKGGAICNTGELNFSKTTFRENLAFGNGGAINNVGKISLTESKLLENFSYDDGGAIRNSGEFKVEKSFLNENASKGDGGAISNCKVFDMSLSILEANSAFYGGAIYDWDRLTISHCKLYRNVATNGKGGAIYKGDDTNYDSDTCDFKDNKPHNVY